MSAKWGIVFVVLSVVMGNFLFGSPATAQILRFDPDPYIPVDENFSVPLLIETGGTSVKGVEATITFDPALVVLDSVTPGAWYSGSGQDFFFWDYTSPFTYAIHFASAMLDGTKNSDGVIAMCHFSFVDFGVCPLEFTLVDVRDANNDQINCDHDDGMIFLDAAVGTKKVGFTSLKAIYR